MEDVNGKALLRRGPLGVLKNLPEVLGKRGPFLHCPDLEAEAPFPLPLRQFAVLAFMVSYCLRYGSSPSLQQIGAGIGKGWSAVRPFLVALKKKGLLIRSKKGRRMWSPNFEKLVWRRRK